jgi:protein-S-isoprenylcysteine O-methyltransferase Ste14
MDLYNKKEKSIPQKAIMVAVEAVLISISYLILFSDRFQVLGFAIPHADMIPRVVIFCFNLVIFTRFMLTFFVFLERRILNEEVFAVSVTLALYYVGFSILCMYSSESNAAVLGLGILLFIAGSFFNTMSEAQRYAWKRRAENKGRLYTKGLFRYSMHINYFGDLLWVSGYALVTMNPYSLIIPALLFIFFYFYNIPKLDGYLKEKYRDEFIGYSEQTKRFIPFLL